MRNSVSGFFGFLIMVMLLTACNHTALSAGETKDTAAAEVRVLNHTMAGTGNSGSALPGGVLDSYYAAQNTSVFEYFHHSSIQRFMAMWVKEKIKDLESPQWNYKSFAKISVLDHDFLESRPDEALYCLTFSDGADRHGYIIAKYHETGPAISNWSVMETTPYQYDLKAKEKEIAASLEKTDIDLSTAKASRVYLFDKEKKRADQVIRFTDGKGDTYICYFGDDSFKIEKW